MERRNSWIDVRNLSVPAVTVVAIVGFFIWLGAVGVNERYKIRDETKQGLDHIRIEIMQIQNNLDRCREYQQIILDNIWTKQDHNVWCRETELQNQGWKCPSYEFLKDNGLLGSMDRHGDVKPRFTPYKAPAKATEPTKDN